MQRSEKPALKVGDFVVTSQNVRGVGKHLATAQIVAMDGETAQVVAEGTRDAQPVKLADVQSYQEVYGIVRPDSNAQPVIDLTRK